MDSLDWLLSAIVDPEALRLNAILLVFFALVLLLSVVVNRSRKLPLTPRTPYGAD
jgi:uncharacterized membrane protein YcfT